jgi:hypothetical protein
MVVAWEKRAVDNALREIGVLGDRIENSRESEVSIRAGRR